MTKTEALIKPNKIEAMTQSVAVPESLNSPEQELPLDRVLGASVREDFNALWKMYTGRRQGMTMHVGQTIFEDDGFVTRQYPNVQDGVEEVFLRSLQHDPGIKSDRGPLETIFVHVLDKSSGEEHEVYVDQVGSAAVMHRADAESQWEPVSFQDAVACVYELSHRRLIAEERHTARTAEEREVADAHARALLCERVPMFAAPETSLE
jgi:hypothetical protein